MLESATQLACEGDAARTVGRRPGAHHDKSFGRDQGCDLAKRGAEPSGHAMAGDGTTDGLADDQSEPGAAGGGDVISRS